MISLRNIKPYLIRVIDGVFSMSAGNTMYTKNGQIPCGLVVRIRGFHPRGPGSIPGMGNFLFSCYLFLKFLKMSTLAGGVVGALSSFSSREVT